MAASLVVLKFSEPGTAQDAVEALLPLQRQQLLRVEDVAIVSWPTSRKRPQIRHHELTSAGGAALGGAFWGFLLGLIFFVPLLGAAIGAAAGAIAGSLADYGIDHDFIAQVREKVTQGTSALFLMADLEAPDRVVEALKRYDPEVIATNFTRDQEAKLRELFAA